MCIITAPVPKFVPFSLQGCHVSQAQQLQQGAQLCLAAVARQPMPLPLLPVLCWAAHCCLQDLRTRRSVQGRVWLLPRQLRERLRRANPSAYCVAKCAHKRSFDS